jgi:hypothetical protein
VLLEGQISSLVRGLFSRLALRWIVIAAAAPAHENPKSRAL